MHFFVELTRQQKGRIAEELAKVKFLSWGFEVYVPEVDERGIDLIVRHPATGCFYEVQVKGATNNNYLCFKKASVNSETKDKRLVCYVRLDDEPEQAFFLIPLSAWDGSNPLFPVYEYDKEGCSSAPEYGISVSKKNTHFLAPYRFDKTVIDLLGITKKNVSDESSMMQEIKPDTQHHPKKGQPC